MNIRLANGTNALVSDEDYAVLSLHRWRTNKDGYVIGRVGGKSVFMHHFILPKKPGFMVDHINRHPSDNRRENLRYATPTQNAMNSTGHCDGSSAYRGVSWSARKGKWHAQIKRGEYRRHIGFFTDEVEAAKAYDAVAKSIDGEFANLNFPNDCKEASPYQAKSFARMGRTTSKYRGVFWNKQSGKWRSRMMCSGKVYEAGQHGSEEDAALAYDNLATKLLGQKAKVNFPKSVGGYHF